MKGIGQTTETGIYFRFFYYIRLLLSLFESLMTPFWVIYFKEVGLSYFEISLLVTVSYIVTLVFEIPTGAVADFWGRKLSVIISLLITGSASMGIYFAHTFPQLLSLYVLSGFGATFMSGAFSAWFADSLTSAGTKVNKEIDLTKYWGYLVSGQQLGNIIGFLLGSALVFLGYFRGIWLVVGSGGLLIALYILIFGKEASYKSSNEHTVRGYLRTIIEGSTYLFKNRTLFILTLASFFWFFSTGILSLAWQPYFAEQELHPKYFGIILTGNMAAALFLVRKTGTLTQQVGGELRLLWLIGFACGGLILLMIAVPNFSWIPFIIYGGIYSLQEPSFQGYLNKLLPSSLRATILSSHSMIISIATIFSMLVFGATADKLGLAISLFISLVICFTATATFMIVAVLRGGYGGGKW